MYTLISHIGRQKRHGLLFSLDFIIYKITYHIIVKKKVNKIPQIIERLNYYS